MSIRFANNIQLALAAVVNIGDGVISVASNGGTTLNAALNGGTPFQAGDYIYGTLVDSANNTEVVKVTALAAGALTVTRAQDGSSQRSFSITSVIEFRVTQGVFNDILAMIGACLTAVTASTTYLTQANAAATYETQAAVAAAIAEATGAPGQSSFALRNILHNGSCAVRQRPAASLAVSRTFGPGDRWGIACSGGSSISGTLGQTIDQGMRSGYGIGVSNGSWTSGSLQLSQRIEATNTLDLNGKTLIATADVYHDFGVATNWYIDLYKPGASDNWASSTLISSSPASAVPSGTYTKISGSFPLGASDASNGLMIVFRAASNTVVNKNARIGAMQLEVTNATTPAATPFERRPYGVELMLCQRHYVSLAQVIAGIGRAGDGLMLVGVQFPVKMRSAPTISNLNGIGANASSVSADGFFYVSSPGAGVTQGSSYTADAELY